MNEHADRSCDLAVAAVPFWPDTDLDAALATVEPYEGPERFAIGDLTDDEWGQFTRALDE